MTDAESIAEQVRKLLPQVKCGTLKFWGEWFGRPYDNWHQLAACEAEGNVLRLHFAKNETLCVWSPRRAVVDQRTFRIDGADRVRWEWFCYGYPQIEVNRYFYDYRNMGDTINAETNVDWNAPNLKPILNQPAVEIV